MVPIQELLDSGTEAEWVHRLSPDLNRNRGIGRLCEADFDPRSLIPVSFKLSKADREAVERAARAHGISVGQFAKRAFLDELDRIDRERYLKAAP
jgi:hypothetical protein